MWKPFALGSALEVGVTVVTVLLGPQIVAAQAVEGVVRHQNSGEPLSGVLVSVLGLDGERIRGVLSNGTGGFSIEVPMGSNPFTIRSAHSIVGWTWRSYIGRTFS